MEIDRSKKEGIGKERQDWKEFDRKVTDRKEEERS
jgi:hypothetical protein